jgi:hypothetical protein
MTKFVNSYIFVLRGVNMVNTFLRIAVFVAFIILSAISPCFGTSFPDIAPKVPCKITDKRVLIRTSVNGSRLLNLILDTGMGFDGVYLFNKHLANEIDMTGAVEVRVPGAGSGEPSTGVMIQNGSLKFGNVTVDSQRVIISHSEYTQDWDADGVIGWNLFGHYTVEIDYDDEQVILHDTMSFCPDSTWTSIPLIFKKNIPIIWCTIEVEEGKTTPVKLYIDLAYHGPVELTNRDNQKFPIPDSQEKVYLGTGLSGDVEGYLGRSHSLTIGDYKLTDIKTTFTPPATWQRKEDEDGKLGNGIIRRFNVIFDYSHKRLYLRPGKYFNKQSE